MQISWLEDGTEPKMRRWEEQRWQIDSAIRATGIEYDQGRLQQIATISGPQIAPDLAVITQRVRKFDDIGPAFAAAARRRETLAIAAEERDESISASESYFIAAQFWASAQWPVLRNDATNRTLCERKRHCYASYARLTDHPVESVQIPFGEKVLHGWLHLPHGHAGKRLPVIAATSGMDGYKERVVSMYGDRFLVRGIAVLAFEGPGQYDAVLDGIPVGLEAWQKAGTAIYDYLASRPEFAPAKIGINGHSFGSFFTTIATSAEPRFNSCSVSATCLEPGFKTIFENAAPSYKRRFMYMSARREEADFDAFVKTLTWERHARNIRCPYLCVSGEFDNLSPLQFTYSLFEELQAPRTLVVYEGAGHGVSGAPSSTRGLYFPNVIADWVLARFEGRPIENEMWWMGSEGQVTKTPL